MKRNQRLWADQAEYMSDEFLSNFAFDTEMKKSKGPEVNRRKGTRQMVE
jgi:hypothetical protein